MCLVWELPGGDTLYVGGGQWDREEERYTPRDPEFGKIIRLEPSQVDAARYLAWWMQERREGRPVDFVTLQLMGDRAAGKTYIAVGGVLMLTVESPRLHIPQALTWAVSKSFEERDEIDREIRAAAPSQWYQYREDRKRYTFVHEATITNVSADDPENVKRGRVDFLLENEIQKLGKRAYLNGLARLKDKGGFSILTGNWPTDRKGIWLYELDEKRDEAKKKGQTYPVVLVEMASAGNKTLDAKTADMTAQIIRDLDPRLAATDLDGLRMPVTDVAYWEWDKLRNLKRPPDSDKSSIVRNITAEITAGRTMRPGGYQYVIGGDFQETPYNVAVVHKIFGTLQDPVAWAIDEIMQTGSEEDLIEELLANGYNPTNSLIVGDGTGQWQDHKHKEGRRTFKVFKNAGFNIVGPVKKKSADHQPNNPKFDDRCRLHNWLLKHERYMVDPLGCPTLAEGLQKCELKAGATGQGRPHGAFAHITDAAGYVAWWLYPDKGKRGPVGGKRLYEGLVDLMRARQVIA